MVYRNYLKRSGVYLAIVTYYLIFMKTFFRMLFLHFFIYQLHEGTIGG